MPSRAAFPSSPTVSTGLILKRPATRASAGGTRPPRTAVPRGGRRRLVQAGACRDRLAHRLCHEAQRDGNLARVYDPDARCVHLLGGGERRLVSAREAGGEGQRDDALVVLEQAPEGGSEVPDRGPGRLGGGR